MVALTRTSHWKSAARVDLLAKTDAMLAEMRRLDELVTHLLEVSRGGPPTREAVRLDDIASAVVERLRSTAEQAGVALTLQRGSRRTLELDPRRVDRALHNLVRNALEAAPRGGHVWLTTRDDDAGRHCILLAAHELHGGSISSGP